MTVTSSAFACLTALAQEAPLDAALVLGSGMASVARRLRRLVAVPFAEIPKMPAASVHGHPGGVVLGDWGRCRVLVFEGRLHYYEGHPWRSVTLPVHVAAALGARLLVLTNAAGGIHEALVPGSLMAVRDHVDWTRPTCWRLPGPGGIGPARPSPYDPNLCQALAGAARSLGMDGQEGIYAAVTGPCYETPAEIRALRTCGADAVGMSTAREVQAARDLGLACAAVSCITNRAAGLGTGPLRHEHVLATAAAQAERLADLLDVFLQAGVTPA
jgi:purine-nucleoside phosphorylase